MKKILSVLLALSMLLSISLTIISCNNSNDDAKESSTIESSSVESESEKQGKTAFTFKVIDGEGKTTVFNLRTDEEMLGNALLAEHLIEGENGQYGLFVKSVNGITADDSKQEWWKLTKNGEMLNTGVDATPIEDGASYEFTLTTGW